MIDGKQKRYLRGLGHHLEPSLQLGKNGLTDAVVAQADAALQAHELVKVRFGRGFEGEEGDALEDLARATRAEVVGTIGHTGLLYRAREEDPGIRLPRGGA